MSQDFATIYNSRLPQFLSSNTAPRLQTFFISLFVRHIIKPIEQTHLSFSFKMAPSLEEPSRPSSVLGQGTKLKGPVEMLPQQTYEPGYTVVDSHDQYEHDDLGPSFPNVHWEPLVEVPYRDKGLNGHPQFRNLLQSATDIFDYNPKIGTEIHGVNLAKLTDAQANDLARLIATRGVVFFRNQVGFDIEAQRKLGQYLGTLHKHATTSVPRKPGLEDVHVVYTDGTSKDQRAFFTPTFLWHSDVSFSVRGHRYLLMKIR